MRACRSLEEQLRATEHVGALKEGAAEKEKQQLAAAVQKYEELTTEYKQQIEKYRQELQAETNRAGVKVCSQLMILFSDLSALAHDVHLSEFRE